jgi:hypothetical protein
MGKYVFAYTGGGMAETPEEQQAQLQAWTDWSTQLGKAIVDFGNPFAGSKTVKPGGSVDGGASGLSGYSVIEAGSLDDAAKLAGGCPILNNGGNVEVYEALEM